MPKLLNDIRLLLNAGKDIRKLNATRGQLLRSLTMLLNDPDEVTRQWACRQLATIISNAEPNAIDDFIRRLLWRINPESGDHSFGIPEAIGEIGALAPEQTQPFVSVLMQYADDEQLLPGILQALGRIGQQNSSIVEPHQNCLLLALENKEPAVFGNAALALARIGRYRRDMESLCRDERNVRVFCEGRYRMARICDLPEMESLQPDSFCFISREQETGPGGKRT